MAGDVLLGDVQFFSVVTVVLAPPPRNEFPGLTSAVQPNGEMPGSTTPIMSNVPGQSH
jgi:hypothetical protein